MFAAPAYVLTITGKNTASATTAIFDASPKPKASSTSGIRATFGIGNSAAISGSKTIRTGRDIAISSPICSRVAVTARIPRSRFWGAEEDGAGGELSGGAAASVGLSLIQFSPRDVTL